MVQAKPGARTALGSALVAVDADAKADELLAQMTRLCARQIFGVQVEKRPVERAVAERNARLLRGD